MSGYGPVARNLSWMIAMRATFTDSNAVKPPTGKACRRKTNRTSPISNAGWITKPEKPAERKAPLPVLGVMATHIVPYGLAYPVKKVSEREEDRQGHHHGHPGAARAVRPPPDGRAPPGAAP